MDGWTVSSLHILLAIEMVQGNTYMHNQYERHPPAEPPQAAEFLQKRLISEFFGFQWQNLAEILSLFKK